METDLRSLHESIVHMDLSDELPTKEDYEDKFNFRNLERMLRHQRSIKIPRGSDKDALIDLAMEWDSDHPEEAARAFEDGVTVYGRQLPEPAVGSRTTRSSIRDTRSVGHNNTAQDSETSDSAVTAQSTTAIPSHGFSHNATSVPSHASFHPNPVTQWTILPTLARRDTAVPHHGFSQIDPVTLPSLPPIGNSSREFPPDMVQRMYNQNVGINPALLTRANPPRANIGNNQDWPVPDYLKWGYTIKHEELRRDPDGNVAITAELIEIQNEAEAINQDEFRAWTDSMRLTRFGD